LANIDKYNFSDSSIGTGEFLNRCMKAFVTGVRDHMCNSFAIALIAQQKAGEVVHNKLKDEKQLSIMYKMQLSQYLVNTNSLDSRVWLTITYVIVKGMVIWLVERFSFSV
jgi:hypothetical protein